MPSSWTNWLGRWTRRAARPHTIRRPAPRFLRGEMLEARITPATFMGGVRVAVGDVNGDGTVDVLTAAGPGGGPHAKVYDGKSGTELYSFYAFDPKFTGGVYIAAGDIDGDGKADIV